MTAGFSTEPEQQDADGYGTRTVSVIIPARNEERNIERAVRSVSRQQGVREVIVVDDDSTDRTGEILAQLKEEYPRLRVLHLDSLPAGWGGKNYAVAAGAEIAAGEWLLFTDADTEHLPGSLEAVLERADAERADLLSLSPGQDTPTWWEKAVMPLVFVQLSHLYSFGEVSDPASPVAAANGQYLLIRRPVYNEVGGHSAVRAEILEDVELARRVKKAGGRLVFLPGAAWVRTRMYQSFGEMWQGWSKNLYPLYSSKLSTLLEAFGELWALDLLLPLAFFALCILIAADLGGNAALLAVVFCFAISLLRQWTYRQELLRLGFNPDLAGYHILGAAILGLLLLNSARAYRLAGQVQWKGRRYPAKGRK